MHDGLDGDDIYIMVEDEFYAIAKTFTQHLHHAEYLRLKNLVKSRTASAASTISRPIDSITAMREETKKKKQAETRDTRTEIVLQQIKGPARPPSDDSGLSDLDETDNAHWRGTALHGLLTASPSKNQTSLIGLQGVRSSTRAAAGYSKAASKPSHTRAKPIDLLPKPSKNPPSTTLPPELDGSSTDDLDAPTAKYHGTASSKTARKDATFRSPLKPSPPSKPPPPPTRLKDPPSNPLRSYPTPDFNSDSNSTSSSTDRTRPVPTTQSQAARRRLKARIERRETEDAKREGAGTGTGTGTGRRGGSRANANDIPVFLV
jgi:hypothetical protein